MLHKVENPTRSVDALRHEYEDVKSAIIENNKRMNASEQRVFLEYLVDLFAELDEMIENLVPDDLGGRKMFASQLRLSAQEDATGGMQGETSAVPEIQAPTHALALYAVIVEAEGYAIAEARSLVADISNFKQKIKTDFEPLENKLERV